MPSKKDPNSISSGGGAKSSKNKTAFPARQNPAVPSVNIVRAEEEAINDHPLGWNKSPLANHLNPNSTSHKASEISIDQKPSDVFDSHNVEGAIDELSALIPPKPPKVGFERGYMVVSGYPDWGVLKLNDSSIFHRSPQSGFLIETNPNGDIYPYYWQPPTPALSNPPFTPNGTSEFNGNFNSPNWDTGGEDPQTDPVFNISDGTYSGGGLGNVYSGMFTRDADHDPNTPNVGIQTLRIYPIGSDSDFGVVVSGMVYPADRGVLALIKYKRGGTAEIFNAQALHEKVVCAILLGKGILGGDCPCDGDVGGIFEVGKDSSGDYDPYEFPGQATGQGDLSEIHTGLISGKVTPHSSNSFYHNYDGITTTFPIASSTNVSPPEFTTAIPHNLIVGDLVLISGHSVPNLSGLKKVSAVTNNTFTVTYINGSNPPAGGGVGGVVVRSIGCSKADYVNKVYPGQVRLGTDPNSGVGVLPEGIPILGANSMARGGGDDNNFFRYRLPYLDDYSDQSSGLKWTPTTEKFRFYAKPTLALDSALNLTNAGNYSAFSKDYYPFQVARYRHRFIVDPCDCHPTPQSDGFDIGSYVLLHFKKEKYFEEYIRDGIIPTAEKLYSASSNDFNQIEHLSNVVVGLGFNSPPATGYHTIRSSIFAENDDGIVAPTVAGHSYTISSTVDTVMYCSGVAYFTHDNFTLNNVTATAIGLFENSYKYKDDPSSMQHPNPVVCSVSAFQRHAPTHNTGGVGKIRRERVEFGLEDLGAYTTTDAPNVSDTASILFNFDPSGDLLLPSFTTDAKMRLYFRRPIGHKQLSSTVLPLSGVGIGSIDNKPVLYHSTNGDLFGNFQINPGVNNRADNAIGTYLPKKSSENFLDEAFRYLSDFAPISAVDPILGKQLAGPGLPLVNNLSLIDIPVSAGMANNVGANMLWSDCSWLQQDFHKQDLATIGVRFKELQVAGLPHRTPPLADGATSPNPSSGILLYPKKDYSNHRPSIADGDLSAFSQPNYAPLTGERCYVRVLNLDSSLQGHSLVTLRIKGLGLQDFAYKPPKSGSADIAIFVKVPGLTTWLDIGRRDGDGPSKQDPLLDGAGCQVIGAETVEGIDQEVGFIYSDVRINVGSSATFGRSNYGEYPLMVKVVMYDTPEVRFYDFEHKIGGNNYPTNIIDNTSSSYKVRGLIGISVLDPN